MVVTENLSKPLYIMLDKSIKSVKGKVFLSLNTKNPIIF